MKKSRNKYLIINILLLSLALILGLGINCCLSFGYGLGDLFYLAPLWTINIIYFILMITRTKSFYNTPIPPIIFGSILLFFIYTIVFNHGPECPCYLY